VTAPFAGGAYTKTELPQQREEIIYVYA